MSLNAFYHKLFDIFIHIFALCRNFCDPGLPRSQLFSCLYKILNIRELKIRANSFKDEIVIFLMDISGLSQFQ